MSERPNTPRRTGPYCLWCYAPLDVEHPKCPRCGSFNPLSLRQKYWTQQADFREAEMAIKILIVLITGALCLFAAISMTHTGGTGAGWFIAIPGLLGVALWGTSSKLTRRTALFNATVFWQTTFLLLALACGWLAWSSGTTGPAWIAGAALGMVLLVTIWSRYFERWKTRRIERGARSGLTPVG